MKYICFIFSFFAGAVASAQPATAYDFTMDDCNGNKHHLFQELDSGKVVIMEFFMLSCSPCIDAGNALEPMIAELKSKCSNKILFYHFGYTNSYTCTQIKNWVTTNGFTSVPFDSGAVQVAYYGGMGMPTMAVVAGQSHKVLFTQMGFSSNDTAIIADSIRTFFNCKTSGIVQHSLANSISVYPNPSDGVFTISGLHSRVQLHLYNEMGQMVYRLPGGMKAESVSVDVPGGLYFLKGEADGERFTKKISIQK